MSAQITAFSVHDESADPSSSVITTADRFERLMRFLDSRRAMVFDYETSGLAWYRDSESVGAGMAAWDDQGRLWKAYVPYRHKTGERQLDFNLVGPAIKRQLEREDLTKIVHNFGFEEHMSRRDGWQIRGPRVDTIIDGRLYNENEVSLLETRAMVDLGRKDAWEDAKRMTQITGKLAKQNGMKRKDYLSVHGYEEVPVVPCGIYCCTDLDHTAHLAAKYIAWGVEAHYPRVRPTELSMIGILTDLESAGMRIDVAHLEGVRASMGRKKADIEARIKDALGGWTFNWSSDDQLRDFLWNRLGCRWEKMTKAGKKAHRRQNYRPDFDKTPYLAVDSDVLESFSDRYPILQWILDWRDADKIESTYTTSILERLDANDYVHGSIKQMGTNTGRMSSEEPNYQNFPSKGPIRAAFLVVGPGWVRLYFDYSQVELRVLAWYSGDPLMRATYVEGANGGDIHETTRREVSEMSGRRFERRPAKVINFGLAYGLTAAGMAVQAKMALQDAEFFMDTFWRRFRGVDDWRRELWALARRQGGCANNVYGRTRRLPELLPGNPKWLRSRAERQMIGSMIQGTAADILKEAMVRVDAYLKASGTGARLCNTVHDEIQVDCPWEYAQQVIGDIGRIMEDVPEFHPIPILADCEITATHWGEKKSVVDRGGQLHVVDEVDGKEVTLGTLSEWYANQRTR